MEECAKFHSYFNSDDFANVSPEEFRLSLGQLEKHESSVSDIRNELHKQSEKLRSLSSWCSSQHFSNEESRLVQLNQK